ncbi:hypothetical protein KIN20_033129 [Parelaphostrongylus tenuis]|uniref:Uncharacterized protein n=1 Tax=Parelaphostrongylus tenuis TaxID=148309 RepID=A0AAD5R7I0_PARTN|nr:hypothetical protein KIN20_033129 [Parelaphostrongylus tenuis]
MVQENQRLSTQLLHRNLVRAHMAGSRLSRYIHWKDITKLASWSAHDRLYPVADRAIATSQTSRRCRTSDAPQME